MTSEIHHESEVWCLRENEMAILQEEFMVRVMS